MAGAQTQNATATSLRVPDGQVLLFTAHAKGVQIYESKARVEDATTFEWVLKGPEADLFDRTGAKFGKHYAGPTWEANDGSKISGTRVSSVPSTSANNVAWLLLKATSTGAIGMMSNTSYVMRVDTHGGVPAKPPTRAGQKVRVHYKATYIFFGAATAAP